MSNRYDGEHHHHQSRAPGGYRGALGHRKMNGADVDPASGENSEHAQVLRQFVDYYYKFLGQEGTREQVFDSFYLEDHTVFLLNGNAYKGEIETKNALKNHLPPFGKLPKIQTMDFQKIDGNSINKYS